MRVIVRCFETIVTIRRGSNVLFRDICQTDVFLFSWYIFERFVNILRFSYNMKQFFLIQFIIKNMLHDVLDIKLHFHICNVYTEKSYSCKQTFRNVQKYIYTFFIWEKSSDYISLLGKCKILKRNLNIYFLLYHKSVSIPFHSSKTNLMKLSVLKYKFNIHLGSETENSHIVYYTTAQAKFSKSTNDQRTKRAQHEHTPPSVACLKRFVHFKMEPHCK